MKLVIIYKLLNVKGEVVYVGQTTNLTNRLARHKKTKKFNDYSYFFVPSVDADVVEMTLIDKYKTKYNKQIGQKEQKEYQFTDKIGICDCCGDEFEMKMSYQRFCTTNCRVKWHRKGIVNV